MRKSAAPVDQLEVAIHDWGIGTYEWQHEGGVFAASERCLELYGWMEASPPGARALWLSVHADDRAEVDAALERALDPEGDGRLDLVHRVVRSNGELVWLRHRARTSFETVDGQRRPRRTVGSVMDVTELRHVQQKLHRTETRFDEAVRGAQFGIFEHNHLEDPKAENLYWSPRMREILGVSEDEPAAATLLLSRVPPDDIEGLHRAAARAHDPNGDGYYDVEHRYIHPVHGARWLLFRSSTYFSEVAGKRHPVRTVGAVLDVTRERQLEESVRQSQKMEAVGRLAGGIAHDFNNMLSAVLGFAHLALEEIGPFGKGYSELQEIITAGERASGLTQQLLAFSRKQVQRPRVVDAGDILTHMGPMLRRLMSEDIEVSLNVTSDPVRIKVDPTHLEQVVLNLALNARDAMTNGGNLVIDCRLAEVDAALSASRLDLTPGRYAVIAVSDEGTGMDAETQARVFEPFFTTKGPGRGTGLGLATVFGIVKQSGGSLSVQSEVDRGSTFEAYIPISEEPLSEMAPLLKSDRSTRTGVILVAEDEPSVRRVAVTVLQRAGYRVLQAAGPREALALASQHEGRIDLLLTDVVMPLMSGPDLARQLTQQRPELGVLYMSGYTDKAIVNHGVLDAGVHLVTKPITPDQLLTVVGEVLGEAWGKSAGR